jgi:uncharacterized membrane protein
MIRRVLRWVLAVAMVAVGVRHFTDPEPFVRIVPAALPAKLALVWISGAAEVLGGVGLLVPRARRWAGYGLIALYVAVFPANVNMALNHLPLGDAVMPTWALWARLPMQAVLIALAWWVSRDDDARRVTARRSTAIGN